MPLQNESQYLVDHLHSLATLDGRFSNLVLVNFNSLADERRGCFSLVFKAFDEDTQQNVALKFFDPAGVMDTYRLNAFRREHEILQGLIGINRCLQLVSGLIQYSLPIPAPGGSTFHLPCEYFAVEWVDEEVDKFFLYHDTFSPKDRILLFLAIAAAVETLHSKGIFHRDLKPDNLRLKMVAGRVEVQAIDLGTAARFDSLPIQAGYVTSVGAPAYASPEARCGLAGNRLIAKYSDLYALGCLLFELFNKDLHIKSLLDRNADFRMYIAALRVLVQPKASDSAQVAEWHNGVAIYLNSVVPVPIDGVGSNVPKGISVLLNEVLYALTHVDIRQRPSLNWVRQRVGSVLKVITNHNLYLQRRKRNVEYRQRRIEKIKRREARIDAMRAKRIGELHGGQ